MVEVPNRKRGHVHILGGRHNRSLKLAVAGAKKHFDAIGR